MSKQPSTGEAILNYVCLLLLAAAVSVQVYFTYLQMQAVAEQEQKQKDHERMMEQLNHALAEKFK